MSDEVKVPLRATMAPKFAAFTMLELLPALPATEAPPSSSFAHHQVQHSEPFGSSSHPNSSAQYYQQPSYQQPAYHHQSYPQYQDNNHMASAFSFIQAPAVAEPSVSAESIYFPSGGFHPAPASPQPIVYAASLTPSGHHTVFTSTSPHQQQYQHPVCGGSFSLHSDLKFKQQEFNYYQWYQQVQAYYSRLQQQNSHYQMQQNSTGHYQPSSTSPSIAVQTPPAANAPHPVTPAPSIQVIETHPPGGASATSGSSSIQLPRSKETSNSKPALTRVGRFKALVPTANPSMTIRRPLTLALKDLRSTLKISPRESKLQETQRRLSEWCRREGRPYEDPDFPASLQSLARADRERYGSSNSNGRRRPGEGDEDTVKWLRPREISAQAQLFVDGFEPGDVIQGGLGDCWFLGAATVLATRPDLFLRLFGQADLTPQGYCIFQFWRGGEWDVVAIDDRIPCRRGQPLYSHCKDRNEMWLALLEKAFAKLHGGYENLSGGVVSQALAELTGGVAVSLPLRSLPPADLMDDASPLWERLRAYVEEGYLMGCSYSASPKGRGGDVQARLTMRKATGLLSNHAYAILELRLVQRHRLIKLRNPWGEGEWTGAWSDKSPLWTAATRAEVGLVDANDGCFWMDFQDFVRCFDKVYMCQIVPDDQRATCRGEWRRETAGGCVDHPTWRRNPQFLISAASATAVTVVLEQIVDRQRAAAATASGKTLGVPIASAARGADDIGQEKHQLKYIGFYVARAGSAEKKLIMKDADIVGAATFTNCSQVTCEVSLRPGLYVIIPSTYEPGAEGSFCVSAVGEGMSLKPIPESSLASVSQQGRWTSGLSGGCRNHSTWRNNPKFALRAQPGRYTVVLQQSSKSTLHAIGFYIFSDAALATQVHKSDFVMGIEACCEVELPSAPPSVSLFILPATFQPGIQDSFTLTVYSTQGNSVSLVPA